MRDPRFEAVHGHDDRRTDREMKTKLMLLAVLVVGAASVLVSAAEKMEGGLPYANDVGVTSVDVSKYPADVQEGYRLMMGKCSKCHVGHRSLNSEKVQLNGSEAEQKEQIAKGVVSKLPEGDNALIWSVEPNVVKKMVMRMMNKDGSGISKDEAAKIYKFLVHDGQQRKLGKPEEWVKARRAMLEKFKAENPKAYEEIYAQ